MPRGTAVRARLHERDAGVDEMPVASFGGATSLGGPRAIAVRAMARLLSSLFAALLVLGCAGPVCAQGLVILVRGTAAGAHPVGSALPPGTLLAAGDRIDVLERGGTRRLDGPTVYAPLARSTAADNARLVVAQLLDRRRNAPPQTAAELARRPVRVRGMAPAVEPSPAALRARFAGGLWTIDAATADATCVVTDTPPRLWRAVTADAAAAAIAPADGGAAVPTLWAAGAEAAAWPMTLPMAATDYIVTQTQGGSARVRLMPLARADTLDALAVALDAAGCRAQLGYLLDQYPGSAPAP